MATNGKAREQLTALPIEPVYSQIAPNEPIQLGTHLVEFAFDGKTYTAPAAITMRFVPKDQLTFVVFGNAVPDSLIWRLALGQSDRCGKLKLIDRNIVVDVASVPAGGERGGIAFWPLQSGFEAREPTDSIVQATFHLFNFPEFRGPDDFVFLHGQLPLEGATLCDRVTLKASGWIVTIAGSERTNKLTNALRAEGGFVITHVGRIEREDGSEFSSEDLIKLETCLCYFLSFALGRWVGINLVVGRNASGTCVYEKWGMRRTAEGRWNASISWFDSLTGKLLAEVFPGFFNLWNSTHWDPALAHSLYWYIAASEGGTGRGIDTGIILAQTALELLAWTYCVKDHKILSARDFKPGGLSASEKFRRFLTSIRIPLAIPTEMKALHSKPDKKWTDSMHAITGVRNSLIHPDAQHDLPHHSFYDAWRLSLWYLDLILLRLCGHNGEYSNRLTRRSQGQLELVPWIHNCNTP